MLEKKKSFYNKIKLLPQITILTLILQALLKIVAKKASLEAPLIEHHILDTNAEKQQS